MSLPKMDNKQSAYFAKRINNSTHNIMGILIKKLKVLGSTAYAQPLVLHMSLGNGDRFPSGGPLAWLSYILV